MTSFTIEHDGYYINREYQISTSIIYWNCPVQVLDALLGMDYKNKIQLIDLRVNSVVQDTF